MQKSLTAKQVLIFKKKPLRNVVFIVILMTLSLILFALLFFQTQEWFAFPFSTLN
jgi:hypothetical protein